MKGFTKNKKKYEIIMNTIPITLESFYGGKVLGISVIAYTKNESSGEIYIPVQDYINSRCDKTIRDKCVKTLKKTIPTIRKRNKNV